MVSILIGRSADCDMLAEQWSAQCVADQQRGESALIVAHPELASRQPLLQEDLRLGDEPVEQARPGHRTVEDRAGEVARALGTAELDRSGQLRVGRAAIDLYTYGLFTDDRWVAVVDELQREPS